MSTIEKILTPYNFTDKNKAERIEKIVIHYVGALGGAKANAAFFASKWIGASFHYVVGFDGEVVQSVEDEDIAWHCGAKKYLDPVCRNSNSLGIELCVRKKNHASLGATDEDWYFEDATVLSGTQLVKEKMEEYNLTPEDVVRHCDVTGKLCPNPYVLNQTDHTWEEFKQLISTTEDVAPVKPSTNTDAAPTKAVTVGELYSVITTTNCLIIREGAGMTFKNVGNISEQSGCKKHYGIVEEVNGWGRLANGKGWICLSFAQKVNGNCDYIVVTTVDHLNVRAGASQSYKQVGAIDESASKKKKYTIIEESNGWGKLKSGAGWIYLAYTKKVS